LIIVSLIWLFTFGYGQMVDYWATNKGFQSISKEGSGEIVFVMPSVQGYPDPNVDFQDCAFSLCVNGTALPPSDIHLNNNNSMSGPYWQADALRSKGAGAANSVTFHGTSLNYSVTIFDMDHNGHATNGDQVTVECSMPLANATSYTLSVFVDIDGTWGIGRVVGTCQN